MRPRLLVLALASFAALACGSSTDSAPAAAVDAGSDAPVASVDPNGEPPSTCTSGAAGGATPPPRQDTAGALSASGEAFVLFGGDTSTAPCGGVPAHTHAQDTWVLDVACRVWHEVKGDGPGPRARHAMVTDAEHRRALLFGGRTRSASSGPYTLLSDVWAFDFVTESWSQLTTSGPAPSGRSNTAIALDATGKQLVVFGGNASTSGLDFTPLDDTWALDLDALTWRKLAPKSKPPARLFHAMAIDPVSRTAYVYSGGDANAFTGPFLSDVWALDLATEDWRELKTSGEKPTNRIKHGMTFDQTTHALVTFGGHDDGQVGNQNDVHALDPATGVWTKLGDGDVLHTPSAAACSFAPDFTTIDPSAPERRSAFAFGARADGHGVLVAQGVGDCGLLGDAYWFAAGSAAWTPLKATPIGLSCLRTQTACKSLCN